MRLPACLRPSYPPPAPPATARHTCWVFVVWEREAEGLHVGQRQLAWAQEDEVPALAQQHGVVKQAEDGVAGLQRQAAQSSVRGRGMVR